MRRFHYRGNIMSKSTSQNYVPRTGEQLKNLAKLTSFGGLFFSLLGTGLVWAGTESFNCPSSIWKMSLIFNLMLFLLAWIFYFPFSHTDRLLGNGLLTILML